MSMRSKNLSFTFSFDKGQLSRTHTHCYGPDMHLAAQQAQLPLREQGVSFVLSPHHNVTVGN